MKNVFKGITDNLSKLAIKVDKYLPEIMFTTSMAAGAAAIVTTALASFKVKEKLDDIDNDDDIENKNIEKALMLCKLYVTPATLATSSAILGFGAFTKMRGRYLGAVAAYNGVKFTFDKYRERVINNEGKEKDFEYMYGADYVVNSDQNNKETKEQHVDSIVPGLSQYAIIWDKYLPDGSVNPNWDENTNFNYMFLRTQEAIMNDLLQSRGHVFLNEVLEAIGYPHTQAGAVVGWVKGYGDDLIDFGLYNNETEKIKRFVNGNPNTIILDFNVDGVIYDLI